MSWQKFWIPLASVESLPWIFPRDSSLIDSSWIIQKEKSFLILFCNFHLKPLSPSITNFNSISSIVSRPSPPQFPPPSNSSSFLFLLCVIFHENEIILFMQSHTHTHTYRARVIDFCFYVGNCHFVSWIDSHFDDH